MSGGLLQQLIVGGCLLILGLMPRDIAADDATTDDVLVTVNGRPITQVDLQLEAILRGIPDDQLKEHRESLLDDLIDQRLIAEFAVRKRAKANPIELEAQQTQLQAIIRRRGEEPQALFERLGIDEDRLQERLALSLAWKAYVERVTSDQQMRAYFQQHRRELDGTQLQARHILLKVPPGDEAARQAATQQLAALRKQIRDGDITFEAAAAQHSQAPSAETGGDVGYFGYRGTMSASFADAAFALKRGDVSEPIETPFGVHLIQVTDERPGQLSLEDVRPQLLERIAKDLRTAQLATDRPRATIKRH